MMQVDLHLFLLAAVVVATVGCAVRYRGRTTRSMGAVLAATSPFLVLGVISGLLLSARGAPVVEWALPMIAVLVVGVTCRSDRAFDVFRWSMTVAALILFVNFLSLVQGDYTSIPYYSRAVSRSLAIHAKTQASQDLQARFGPEEVIPEGPVSGILGEPKYDRVETLVVERQWYTPITRLSRVRKEPASLWYPGGAVETGSKHLEVRATVAADGAHQKRS